MDSLYTDHLTDTVEKSEIASYNIGDYVIYKNCGICYIVDLLNENFRGIGEKKYYVLRSVFDKGTVVHVPVDLGKNKFAMKKVLSADEINQAIEDSHRLEDNWIDDNQLRALHFEQILNEGDRTKILWVAKALSNYKSEAKERKKKMYASDIRMLASADKVIKEEFSFVLGISKDEVVPYIKKQINKISH